MLHYPREPALMVDDMKIDAASVTLRPVLPEDDAFLLSVYASTRAEELAAWGWDAAQRDSFSRFQVTAQQRHYATQFPDADHSIILLNERPIGRILVARTSEEMVLVDIALLAEHRNTGVGTSLILDLLTEGAKTGKPVRLHVLRLSAAVRLYERLGFSKIGDEGIHYHMEWTPYA